MRHMQNIDKVKNVLKNDVKTVPESLSKDDYNAAINACSFGHLSPITPSYSGITGQVERLLRICK